MTALRPEPHTLLTVKAAMVSGRPAFERRLPGRVLAHARLEDVAHDDFVDLVRRRPGAAQRLGDGDGPELRGRHIGQGAEVFADGRAGRGEEKGVGHEGLPGARRMKASYSIISSVPIRTMRTAPGERGV